MFCAILTSRYQVSVYSTNGPLVLFTIYGHGGHLGHVTSYVPPSNGGST